MNTGGAKARMVVSVATSSGVASRSPASRAAAARSNPSPMRRTVSSTTTLALSTRAPSAMMKAAAVTWFISTPSGRSTASVARMVTGSESPTIGPARAPSAARVTSITTARVCQRLPSTPSMVVRTTAP